MSRARRLIGAVAAAVAVVLAMPAGTALAHASLDDSTPPSGATLEEAPPELVLDFDEVITTDLGGVELSTSDGEQIAIGEPTPTPGDATRLVVGDIPALDDGVYVVVWEVTSDDGHPARGAFTFQIGTQGSGVDTDAVLAAALDGREASTAVTWLLGVARFLAFVGLCLLAGGLFLHHVTGGGVPSRRVARSWWTGVVALAVGSVGVFVLQGPYLTAGTMGDVSDTSLWGDVAGMRLGTAVIVRLVLIAVVAVLLRRTVRTGRGDLALLALSGCMVLTFSLTGHPSATPPVALSVLLDALHFGAVALWLGGLFALALGNPGVRPFSRVATMAVPVIVATGVLQTWRLIDSWSDVTATDWGKALLVKTSIVILLVTLGGVSRYLVHHDPTASIRRIVVAEVVVGSLVLGVTAGLVSMPPTPPPATALFEASLVEGSLIADVSVTPGRVGSNEIHVVFSPPGGTLQPVVGVEARMSLESADIPAVPIALTNDGPNHYIGTFQVPRAGDWKLDLVVEPVANSTVLMSTTVPIPG